MHLTHPFRLAAAGLILLSLTACGTLAVAPVSPSSSPLALTPQVTPRTSQTPQTARSPSMTVFTEPQAGVQPWVTLIDQARTGIEVNAYLIDNAAILTALRQAGQRGVPIHILLAPNPYDDTAAVPGERQALAQVPDSTVRNAPPRFDQAYAFDHAKYIVINPDTAQVTAIIGSPNFTDSAFDGANLEAAAEVTEAPAQAAAQVFQADWTDQPAGSGPRQTLIVSPGSEPTLLALLKSSGPLEIMAEEVGDAPALDAQLEADGSRVHLLIAASQDASDKARAQTLGAAGVQVRVLSQPYVHAKLIVTTTQAFLGSENLSDVSLDDNREMGLTVTGSARTTLTQWFQRYWAEATPLGTVHTSPSPSRSASASWLPIGDTMAQVRAAWGPPVRTYPTTYHGQAQVAWVYAPATVYFVHGTVADVSDHSSP